MLVEDPILWKPDADPNGAGEAGSNRSYHHRLPRTTWQEQMEAQEVTGELRYCPEIPFPSRAYGKAWRDPDGSAGWERQAW
jgi:hypothetical protein